MPDPKGFTPDPVGFTPDPPAPSMYQSAWDTAAGMIPEPVKSGWEELWKPRTSKFSETANKFAEPLWQELETKGGISGLPDFTPAYMQSLGQVGDSLTSIGNLATTFGTGGGSLAARAGLPRVAQAVTGAGRIAGGLTAAHGAQAMANPESSMMDRGLGLVEAVGGGFAARAPKPKPIPAPKPRPRINIEPLPSDIDVMPVRDPATVSDATSEAAPQSQAPHTPKVRTEVGIDGNTRVWIGDVEFTDRFGPGGPTMSEVRTLQSQINDPESFKRLAELKGEKYVGMAEPQPTRTGAFDPSKLQGLKKTPAQTVVEVDFVDPTTGEVRNAANARPGDIPLSSRPAPTNVSEWIDELVKGEEGTDVTRRTSKEQAELTARSEEATPVGEGSTAPVVDEATIRDLGLDSVSVEHLPQSIHYYENRGRSDIADYLNNRFIAMFRNKSDEELIRFADHYDRLGQPWISEELRALVQQRADEVSASRPRSAESIAAEQPAPSLEGMPNPDDVARRAALVSPDLRRSMDSLRDEYLQDLVNTYINNPEPYGESGRNAANYGLDLLYQRRAAGNTRPPRSRFDVEPTTSHTGGEHEFREPESTASPNSLEWNLNQESGVLEPEPIKPPPTPEQRTAALTRLGKIIGEDRAQKFGTGEAEIKADQKPIRPTRINGRDNTGGKISPSTAKYWSSWGDRQINQYVEADAGKPGMTIAPTQEWFPKRLEIAYRDAEGNPIGMLSTNLDGSGISTLAVKSTLGLRRGKVAIEMLKEAFDRGITEPSGVTSDWTKNLIDRVKSIVRGEEGTLDIDAMIKSINEMMDGIAESKIGKAVSRFVKSDAGTADLDRFQELFQKRKAGTITPEELAEAKQLAPKVQAEAAAQPVAPPAPGTPARQINWKSTRKTKTPKAEPETPKAAKLPTELAGAKPRFNIGPDSYQPSFADDLDKALFIIAQKTKSKSDAQYLKFVMEQTGMDERAARLAAQGVRNTIKNLVSGQEPGVVRIESIFRKNQEPTPVSAKPPKVTAQEAGTGKIAEAANEPVKATAAGETPKRSASQAAAELSERMKRAVENPNQASVAQDIQDILDEATEVINKMPEADRPGAIRQILGANKALLTSWDLSAPGRQGKAFILNKAWWTSLDDMVRAWGSPKAAQAINESIINHPSGYFQPKINKFGKAAKSFAEEMGLDLASTEEVYSTKLGQGFEKYSGVGKSSRAHTAFLNKLRSDQFVAMMNDSIKAGLDPMKNTNLAKTYAKFINDATGRGSLNVGKWKLERNVGAINDVFFAPKNMSGQIRTWNNVLNPYKYYNYDPVMRKQALRSLFAVAGMGLAVGEMARQMGAKVSNNPTSSDFRKIKVGDTRIDLFGGYQQFPVAAMKFMSGTETPTSGDDAGKMMSLDKNAFRTRGSVAERFFTNRLSPVGSFVWAWMFNREFDGKPFKVKRALFERTAPIVTKDLYDLAKEDPVLAAIMTPTNTLGLTGTQTYGR